MAVLLYVHYASAVRQEKLLHSVLSWTLWFKKKIKWSEMIMKNPWNMPKKLHRDQIFLLVFPLSFIHSCSETAVFMWCCLCWCTLALHTRAASLNCSVDLDHLSSYIPPSYSFSVSLSLRWSAAALCTTFSAAWLLISCARWVIKRFARKPNSQAQNKTLYLQDSAAFT